MCDAAVALLLLPMRNACYAGLLGRGVVDAWWARARSTYSLDRRGQALCVRARRASRRRRGRGGKPACVAKGCGKAPCSATSRVIITRSVCFAGRHGLSTLRGFSRSTGGKWGASRRRKR